MAILSFLVHLMAAVMLLLFAIQMIRTGIEHSFGASFKRQLTQRQSVIGASISGVVLAVVLQSSAAVAVLVAAFSVDGFLAFAIGLAIVLGGDLGSALLIQILSFKMDWLIPVLLAFGGWLFVKSRQKSWHEAGRILMGIAFVLISLKFLKGAVEPIRDSFFLPAIANYLANDFITAFIVGAFLALVMHSSVATILMCVALLQIGSIPFDAALSLVLGANLGSGLIPIWLTRGIPPDARRVPAANSILRGGYALIILIVINVLLTPEHLMVAGPAQSLISAHIAFNLTLLLLILPFCRLIETPMARILPSADRPGQINQAMASVLDKTALRNPSLTIAGLKRELLRMTEQVDQMLRSIPEIFETGDQELLAELRKQNQSVNGMLSDIRTFVSFVPHEAYSKHEMKVVNGLMDYAIRLKAAGDVTSQRLTELSVTKRSEGIRFSLEGWKELLAIHDAVCANFALASNVLISDDLESARSLIAEKVDLKKAERKSQKRHLKRIHSGRADSFESSDTHLEVLRALRDINSHVCAVAYPILYRNGQLLETRLVQEIGRTDGS